MQNLQVLNNIQNHVKLSSTEEAYFLSKISTQKVSKKELILRQGQICRKLFFLESGCLRAYNINDEGKESTIMFALSDWWITDMHAFLNQKAALLSIEALDSSNLIGLSFSALENLYKEIPKFEKIFRILFQKSLCSRTTPCSGQHLLHNGRTLPKICD